jgi:hypothetical protein
MVQTANLRDGDDVAGRSRLYGTGSQAVLAEREMCSGVMTVLKMLDKTRRKWRSLKMMM